MSCVCLDYAEDMLFQRNNSIKSTRARFLLCNTYSHFRLLEYIKSFYASNLYSFNNIFTQQEELPIIILFKKNGKFTILTFFFCSAFGFGSLDLWTSLISLSVELKRRDFFFKTWAVSENTAFLKDCLYSLGYNNNNRLEKYNLISHCSKARTFPKPSCLKRVASKCKTTNTHNLLDVQMLHYVTRSGEKCWIVTTGALFKPIAISIQHWCYWNNWSFCEIHRNQKNKGSFIFESDFLLQEASKKQWELCYISHCTNDYNPKYKSQIVIAGMHCKLGEVCDMHLSAFGHWFSFYSVATFIIA